MVAFIVGVLLNASLMPQLFKVPAIHTHGARTSSPASVGPIKTLEAVSSEPFVLAGTTLGVIVTLGQQRTGEAEFARKGDFAVVVKNANHAVGRNACNSVVVDTVHSADVGASVCVLGNEVPELLQQLFRANQPEHRSKPLFLADKHRRQKPVAVDYAAPEVAVCSEAADSTSHRLLWKDSITSKGGGKKIGSDVCFSKRLSVGKSTGGSSGGYAKGGLKEVTQSVDHSPIVTGQLQLDLPSSAVPAFSNTAIRHQQSHEIGRLLACVCIVESCLVHRAGARPTVGFWSEHEHGEV